MNNVLAFPLNKQMLAQQEHQKAIQQIKENLDRLQHLHHKLHAMLEELNHITKPERRKR